MSDFDDVEPNLPPTKAEPISKVRKVTKPAAAVASEKVRIILEENPDIPPTGLFLGLNGTGYLIRPGEEVEIPRGVREILDHAVMSSPVIDPSTQQVIGYRDRMRYPYRVVNS